MIIKKTILFSGKTGLFFSVRRHVTYTVLDNNGKM